MSHISNFLQHLAERNLLGNFTREERIDHDELLDEFDCADPTLLMQILTTIAFFLVYGLFKFLQPLSIRFCFSIVDTCKRLK
uniref:Uncharacterized protein n=1 Tax=Rhizophora mucronata TaxID=61149 RepID=A0A2P2N293_RHIMU